MKKELVTETDLFTVLDIIDKTDIVYFLDGGWGVDVLTGKQHRQHRDIDIDFDANYTQELLTTLQDFGYETVTDWLPARMELWHPDYGYLDIHPFIFDSDGSAKQADLEGGFYQFEKDFFTSVHYQGRLIPCISQKAQLLFHSGYELRESDLIDIQNLHAMDN
ncbi:nucleotidyltransferase domain-containing protein [Enterococcus sp. LJL120]